MTLLKGFDINNDLAKIYEEKIPHIKQKNLVKEQEIICDDLSAFLNAWRDNKKTQYQSNSNLDYASNSGTTNILDDKGKKKLDILQGFRKNDYSSNTNSGNSVLGNSVNINSTTTGSNNYESTDNKSKNDFQKFLGMNANKTAAASDSSSILQRQGTINANSALNSLKGKNPDNIKVNFIKNFKWLSFKFENVCYKKLTNF